MVKLMQNAEGAMTSYVAVISNHNAQRNRSKLNADRSSLPYDYRQSILQDFLLPGAVQHIELLRQVTRRTTGKLAKHLANDNDNDDAEEEDMVTYDLLLVSHTELYKLCVSRDLDWVFLNEIKTHNGDCGTANKLGKTMQLDVLALYEQAADMLLGTVSCTPRTQTGTSTVDVTGIDLKETILHLYQESNAPVGKIIRFLKRSYLPCSPTAVIPASSISFSS